jgi:response regulator RpfG family c-di-GMP phosphodiesterase
VSSTVLIADDDVLARGTLGGWLETAGYDCVPSGTADALGTMRRDATDAVIVGVNHVDDGGMWIVRRLCSQANPVGVIVVATPPSIEIATSASRLGAVDCLPGPSSATELLNAVRRAVLWRNAVLSVGEDEGRLEHELAIGRARFADAVSAAEGNGVQSALLGALRARTPWIVDHAHRVASMATELARAMEVPAAEVERIRAAALLHEVGRIAIPDRLMAGGGALADNEIMALRSQLRLAHDALGNAPGMGDVAAIIAAMRERFDGSGHPAGLYGTAIPLAARILAVADAYDSLVSERSYRDPMSRDAANAELVRLAGTAFDPRVVRTWIHLERPSR